MRDTLVVGGTPEAITIAGCADRYIAQRKASRKHSAIAEWPNTLRTCGYRILGDQAVRSYCYLASA
jgi:hypothetical protein